MQDPRPNPDLLLQRVNAQERSARQGKLKIFLGFAPGVGKTYRMLQVAHELKAQGIDVVVGIVETHGRPETQKLCAGITCLPRKVLNYRGKVLEELNLEAALARKPAVLLVDELAHSNTGTLHPKRWQDVAELLDAGIDVLSTMNVQHLESLNDIVTQITQVKVHETVPDSVLDTADNVELIDITPAELRQRLRDGKVYLPDQAERAAQNFFKHGNLLALRELALRRVAQYVDDDVRAYRNDHDVAELWPAGERILVCVGPAPSSARLIRSAARMAAGLRCPWVAVYVEALIPRQSEPALETHLKLAESLGAHCVRLTGNDVAVALLNYAKKQNVTRIVIGKPTHSRLRDRMRGSLLDDVVRGSSDIEVHVISGHSDTARAQPQVLSTPTHRSLMPYLWSLTLTALTTAVAVLVRTLFPVPDLHALFLLTVMLVAVRFGRGPAIAAATLGVAAYDLFLVPPYYTFAVSDARFFLTFAMMFGVGVVVSELVARLRNQEQQALLREQRTVALYRLTRSLSGLQTPLEVAEVVTQQAADVFDAHAFVVRSHAGKLTVDAAFPHEHTLHSQAMGVAQWCLDHGKVAGVGTSTLAGAQVLCAPFNSSATTLGVLVLKPCQPKADLRMDQRDLLETFCQQSAFALERIRLADEARAATLRARTEELRNTLLSTVSHDLRTPLGVITGAATTLRDNTHLDATTQAELLESICEEAERLERLLTNLLDMTRLESGNLAIKREWVPAEELISSALTRLESQLKQRPVSVHIADALPLLYIDPVLFEQVLINLLENAIKYTPTSSPIIIEAQGSLEQVTLQVKDQGPGLPRANPERVFEKFYRGQNPGVLGAGLGLPISRGIVEAHGGTLEAQNSPQGGAVFSVVLPLTNTPPTVHPEDSHV